MRTYNFQISRKAKVSIMLSVIFALIAFGIYRLTIPQVINVNNIDVPVPNQVNINFKAGTSDEEKLAYINSIGGNIVNEIKNLDSITIEIPEGANLADSEVVANKEPEYLVSALEDTAPSSPNDPRYSDQWALPVIEAEKYWNTSTDVKVIAVIDSGICVNHEDLAGKIDLGWDFVENDGNPQDEMGHGCAVAGIIAANINNGIGIAGVSTNARIMPLRVLDKSGLGTYSNVAAAIVYAVDNGADVINLSLGGSNSSTVLENAVKYAQDKGVVIVAAAGNTGKEGVLYPAKYDYVIAVGSVDQSLERSSFSSYGPEIDILAPGKDILSTSLDGTYRTYSGTSFAAPLVSGMISLDNNFVANLRFKIIAANQSEDSETDISKTTVVESFDGTCPNAVTIYEGVKICSDTSGGRVDYLEIDPNNPFVRFETALSSRGDVECNSVNSNRSDKDPHHSNCSDPYPYETVSNILKRYQGRGAIAAINTDYFGANGQPTGDHGAQGLAIKNGTRLDGPDHGVYNDVSYNQPSLAISRKNELSIDTRQSNNYIELNRYYSLYNTVSGAPLIINNGQRVNDNCTSPYPNDTCSSTSQSAGGITSAGKLILATAARNSVSLADFLLTKQVNKALKFDGGGSAGLAWIKDDGSIEFYSPSEGDRPIAEVLLVFSKKTSQLTSCEQYDSNLVTLYKDPNCSGTKREYPSTTGSRVNFIFPDEFNDSISSIKVKPGYSVRVYKDHSFISSTTSRCITASMWNLAQDYFTQGETGLVINEQISSIQVFNDTSCGNGNDVCVLGLSTDSETPVGALCSQPTPEPGGTSQCPSNQNGLYCGSSVGGSTNTLYQCTNGNIAAVQSCTYGCHVNPQGIADACNSAGSGGTGGITCPSGTGNYCGGTLGLDQNTLYYCSNGTANVVQSCQFGCFYNSAGKSDFCKSASASACPSGNGDYCGSSLGLDPNTLYTCTNGNSVIKNQCSNGCQQNAPGTPDICKAGSSEKVKLFGDSDGQTNLRMETSVSTNEPSKNALYKSMTIPAGWSVKIYDSDDYHGNNQCYSSSQYDLETQGWYNRIESIEVFTTNVCQTPQSGDSVKICTQTGGGGNCTKISFNIPSLGDFGFGNDTLKSIYIEGSWEAVLYQDDRYQGPFKKITDSQNDLNWLSFQYGTSSIVVRRKEPSRIILYDLGDRNGEQFKSDRSLSDLGYWDWNDRAGSVYVEPGYEVILCQHSDFKGVCGRANTSHNNLDEIAQGLQDQVSSFQICEGSCPAGPNATLIYPFRDASFVPGSEIPFSWSGTNALEYMLEVTGGNNYQYTSSWGDLQTKTLVLPVSANAYSWRVKSWSNYGESEWTSPKPFYVQDIGPTSLFITGEVNPIANQDYTYTAYVNPVDAGNLTYTWSPAPKSGQGSNSVVYNWASTGSRKIALTVSNTGGNISNDYDISVGCSKNQYLGYYFNNTSLTGSPDFTYCEDNIDYDWGSEGPVGNSPINLTVNQNEVYYTDSARTYLTSTASIGASNVFVNNSQAFDVGDEILIITMIGNNAGVYEKAKVLNVSTNEILLNEPLKNSYISSSISKVQILKIPIYKDVNIYGTITAHAWNGYTGGIVAFNSIGTTTIGGTGKIVATGLGYEGGAGGSESPASKADTGNTGGSYMNDNQINGPVAGGDCGGCTSPQGYSNGGAGTGGIGSRGTDAASGGAGGSFGTQGNYGSSANVSPYQPGGIPGSTYGDAGLTRLYFGSGGGGGGKGKDGYGDQAGAGGGIIILYSNDLQINGQIINNGGNAIQNGIGNAGGAGGGAGGSILIESKNINSANNSLLVNGGNASNGQSIGNGRPGGSGGLGRIRVNYCNAINGVLNPGAYLAQIDCSKDNFSARWSGDFDFIEDTYKISAKSDDGLRLWFDNNLIIDEWTDGIHNAEVNVPVNAGTHNIKVEYYESTGDANILVNVSPSSNQAPQIKTIPDQLITIGEDFQDIDLKQYATDSNTGDKLSWEISGNSQVMLDIDSNQIAHFTVPQNWQGEEDITFKVSDLYHETASTTAKFKRFTCSENEYLASYYDNNDPSGALITQCESAINHDWGDEGPEIFHDFGDGRDGDLVISQPTVDNPVIAQFSTTAGSYQLNTSGANFEVGERILTYQTIGSNAGTYQLNEITNYSQGIITVKYPMKETYTNGSGNVAQVMVVRQYNNLTINSTFKAKPWDGTTGGLLFFMVKGTMNNNYSIDADGSGYRGGAQTNAPRPQDPFYGYQGEGYLGIGTRSPSANTNGGGGGIEPDRNGGAGGSNSSSGVGGYGGGSQSGLVVGDSELTKIYFGGGGGAAAPGGGGMENGLAGGKGGGILGIYANNIVSTGYITSIGSNGGIDSKHFGGGGGAGGTVKIFANTFSQTGTMNVSGGAVGGNRPGGAGGLGRIRIDYCNNYSGNNPAGAIINQVSCQLNENFTVKWDGFKNFDLGRYRFSITSDEKAKLYIDGNLLIDKQSDIEETVSEEINLTAGRHEIQLEYIETTGNANIALDTQLVEYEFEGEFFNNIDLNGIPAATLSTKTIDYQWDASPIDGINADNFSVRWNGDFNFVQQGDYTFSAIADDGVRLFVDDSQIIDAWFNQGATEYKAKLNLSTGSHNIRLEYYDLNGSGKIKLSWEYGDSMPVSPGCNNQQIGEYCVEYFNNTDFTGTPVYKTLETEINHDWQYTGPGNNVRSENFSAKWSGIQHFDGGTYKFDTSADDAIKVFVDSNVIFDSNNLFAGDNIVYSNIPEGDHQISMEYKEFSGSAVAKMSFVKVSGIVNKLDDHFVDNSNWFGQEKSGFTISNENESLKVETSNTSNDYQEIYSPWLSVVANTTYYLAFQTETVNADQSKLSMDLYDQNMNFIVRSKTINGTKNTTSATEYRTSYKVPKIFNGKTVKYARLTLYAGDKINNLLSLNSITKMDNVYFDTIGRPYASLVTPTTFIKDGDTVTLNASASSPNGGSPIEYIWTQLSGPDIGLIQNQPVQIITLPQDDRGYDIQLKLQVKNAVESIPIYKTLTVNGVSASLLKEDFVDINNWRNLTLNDFTISNDSESLLVSAINDLKVSKIQSPIMPVLTQEYRMKFRLKTEDIKAIALRIYAYNASFAAVSTSNVTCSITGMTPTKDWKEFVCDFNKFKINPNIRHAKISIEYTSNSNNSKTWFDYFHFYELKKDIAPVIAPISDQIVDEDTPFQDIDFSNYVSDVNEGEILTYSISTGVKVKATLNGTIAKISVPANWNGQETLVLTVKDAGGLSSTTNINFIVNSINDIPQIESVSDQTINEGEKFTTILLHAADPDIGDIKTWSGSGNHDLILKVNATSGAASVTVPAKWSGEEDITFTVTDSFGGTTSTTAKFKVIPVTTPCITGYYNSEYFDTNDLSGNASGTTCISSIDFDWGNQAPSSLTADLKQRFGDGSSGDLNVAVSTTSYLNEVRSALNQTVPLGQSSLILSQSSGFNVGDEILIIQSKGTYVGSYEFNKITGINANTLTLNSPLIHSFIQGNNDKAQIVKVYNFNNVTVDGTLTAYSWDGNTGGVIAFRVKGNMVVNGVIDLTGKGYRGGTSSGTSQISQSGEGISSSFPEQNTPIGNAGGGANQALEGGPGGGGGSNATNGSDGVHSAKYEASVGGGAVALTNPNFDSLYFGGGGGAGARAYSNPGGAGGYGGGIMIANIMNLQINGLIKSNGDQGGNGSYRNPAPENQYGNSGGGGGGAGGSIYLQVLNGGIGNSKFQVNGGLGGNNSGSSGFGGAGGNGFVRIDSCNALSGNLSGIVNVMNSIICGTDNFSARFSGKKYFDANGSYSFKVSADDGYKLYIDGVLIDDKWAINGYSENISLKNILKGVHLITLEYRELTGTSKVKLEVY